MAPRQRAQFSGQLSTPDDPNGRSSFPIYKQLPPHQQSLPDPSPSAASVQSAHLDPPVQLAYGEPIVEGEDDTCFICAEPFKYYAVGVCNHVCSTFFSFFSLRITHPMFFCYGVLDRSVFVWTYDRVEDVPCLLSSSTSSLQKDRVHLLQGKP